MATRGAVGSADDGEQAAWLLVCAFAILAVPTFVTLADQEWPRDDGLGGLLVLMAATALLWSRRSEFRDNHERGRPHLIATWMMPALAVYVFGRAYDFISLETAGLYGAGLSLAYARLGGRALRRNWFVFAYPALAIPVPSSLLLKATALLKYSVASSSALLLQVFGLPVAQEGVTIQIAQYRLFVDDACSGMNSIMALVALTLLYVYLARPLSLRYALLMIVIAVPISIAANIFR